MTRETIEIIVPIRVTRQALNRPGSLLDGMAAPSVTSILIFLSFMRHPEFRVWCAKGAVQDLILRIVIF